MIDPAYLEELNAYYGEDKYAMESTAIRIVDAEPGRAVVEIQADERHQNAKNGVMGGVFLTMADFASSIADYRPDELNMTVDCSMQFLDVPRDRRITATSTITRRGRRTAFCHVDVTDGAGTLIATGLYTLMHRPRPDAS